MTKEITGTTTTHFAIAVCQGLNFIFIFFPILQNSAEVQNVMCS